MCAFLTSLPPLYQRSRSPMMKEPVAPSKDNMKVALDHRGNLWTAERVSKERDSEFKGWTCALCGAKMHWVKTFVRHKVAKGRRDSTTVKSFFRHNKNVDRDSMTFMKQHSLESQEHLHAKAHVIQNLATITFVATLCQQGEKGQHGQDCRSQTILFHQGEVGRLEKSFKDWMDMGLLPASTLHMGTRPDITILNSNEDRIMCFIEVQKTHAREPQNWTTIRQTGIPALQVPARQDFRLESNVWYDRKTCHKCLLDRTQWETEQHTRKLLLEEAGRTETERMEVVLAAVNVTEPTEETLIHAMSVQTERSRSARLVLARMDDDVLKIHRLVKLHIVHCLATIPFMRNSCMEGQTSSISHHFHHGEVGTIGPSLDELMDTGLLPWSYVHCGRTADITLWNKEHTRVIGFIQVAVVESTVGVSTVGVSPLPRLQEFPYCKLLSCQINIESLGRGTTRNRVHDVFLYLL